jgi:hypothetical protein
MANKEMQTEEDDYREIAPKSEGWKAVKSHGGE